MHPSRLVVLTAAAVGALSLPVRYLTTDLVGVVAGWDAAAWPGVALLLAAGVVALTGDRREGLPAPGTVLVVLLTAAATVFALAKLVDAGSAVDVVDQAAGTASIGVGAWMLAATSVFALGGAVATASRRVV